jgi:hypothetical protein
LEFNRQTVKSMAGELTPPAGQILMYEDGSLSVRVRLDGETVWLPQRAIADLFQVSVPTVNEHLRNIYDDDELGKAATIRSFRIVQREGTRDIARSVDDYSLDAIMAVGDSRASNNRPANATMGAWTRTRTGHQLEAKAHRCRAAQGHGCYGRLASVCSGSWPSFG